MIDSVQQAVLSLRPSAGPAGDFITMYRLNPFFIHDIGKAISAEHSTNSTKLCVVPTITVDSAAQHFGIADEFQ
jgi:hypothetical protein